MGSTKPLASPIKRCLERGLSSVEGMAFGREQGVSSRASPSFENFRYAAVDLSSLAAQAIRTSAAHRDSSFDSLANRDSNRERSSPTPRFYQLNQSSQRYRKTETPPFQKSSNTIASSLNYIGGTIKKVLEEDLTIVENKTSGIIHETRKLHISRKGSGHNPQNQAAEKSVQLNFPDIRTDYETQLKASRDVANAMAAKAKLLLQELKTVKADLAFTRERCAQLEEENEMLREDHEKGSNPEDDDLIRLQLETLLAEKARLAHENSIRAQENRFLREIVEYRQLTMQDVVNMGEGTEEVTEVYSNIVSATKFASGLTT